MKTLERVGQRSYTTLEVDRLGEEETSTRVMVVAVYGGDGRGF